MCAKASSPYDLLIRPSAKRDLKKLKKNRVVRESVDTTISNLKDDPRPFGVKHLGGVSYRIRDGEFRILYDVDDENQIVAIERVRDRKEVYKH